MSPSDELSGVGVAESPAAARKQVAEPKIEAAPLEPAVASTAKYASREDFLAAAGKLDEQEHHVDGIGLLLLSEITGDDRAKIVGESATAMNRGELDVKSYQRALLLAGVVDPTSPPGERRPLFRAGDIDRVMKVGGKKLLGAIDIVEKLSAMGRYQESAEENSEGTPSDAGTSA